MPHNKKKAQGPVTQQVNVQQQPTLLENAVHGSMVTGVTVVSLWCLSSLLLDARLPTAVTIPRLGEVRAYLAADVKL